VPLFKAGFYIRQKAPETPDAFAFGPSIATISWGENGIIVGTPMLTKCAVVKANNKRLNFKYFS
jgi:hypothetical protein